MTEIIRHQITDEYMQMIPTRKVSTFLNVRQENHVSQPELYIIEDDTSPEVLKTIMVLGHKECIALEDTEQLEFIGTFINGDNIDLFVVFELK
jgi:hypothetical protein